MLTAESNAQGHSADAPASRRRGHFPLISVLLIALAALWPPIVNGGPFYMSDTPSYVRAADSGFFKLFGIRTGWTEEYLRIYEGAASASSADPTAEAEAASADQRPVTLQGRSVFYGVLLYAAQLAGNFWFVVVIQSLLAALCIYLTLAGLRRAAGREPRPRDALLIGLVVAVATPLGYFTGYLMPDVFGGFALLAIANLLFLWDSLSRRVRAFWLAVLAYSLLLHGVNLMMVLVLTLAGLLYLTWNRTPPSKGQWMGIGACILGAFAGQTAFSRAVETLTGAAPVRPPFIAMRLIADGPGHEYLKEHCGRDRYIYCRVANQSGLHSDVLLWSKEPSRSLFRGLPPHEQRLSAAQERRFLLDVAADRPLAVLGTALDNSVDQLLSFNLACFNYSAENRQRFADAFPAELFASVTRTRGFANTMPTAWTETLSLLAALASLAFISSFFYLSRGDPALRPVREVCVWVLAGIAVNAALCGALSGPKGRYEMRLIWVLPLVAGGVATLDLNRRRSVFGRPAHPVTPAA